jgi:hypothetical protein
LTWIMAFELLASIIFGCRAGDAHSEGPGAKSLRARLKSQRSQTLNLVSIYRIESRFRQNRRCIDESGLRTIESLPLPVIENGWKSRFRRPALRFHRHCETLEGPIHPARFFFTASDTIAVRKLTDSGEPRRLVGHYQRLISTMVTLMGVLGMTPAGRQNIGTTVKDVLDCQEFRDDDETLAPGDDHGR